MTDIEFQLENFILYCASKNLSKKTLASYEQTIKLFIHYLRDQHDITDVKKVQSGHIRHYIKHVKERGKYTVVSHESSKRVNFPDNRTDYGKPVSATTVANYLRIIKVFFNYLHQIENEIFKNPCEKIENIKPERKVKKLLDQVELKRLLKSFDTTTFHGYRNYMITKLLLDTGMRISECLALEPKHLDLIHKTILVTNPKNKQERYVYFSPSTGRELRRWMRYRDFYSDSIYLFPTTRGTQLKPHLYEKALREVGRSIDVSVHPHQLRNNFAKYYILNGGDWFTLSRILGHSSVEVTQKAYLDFSDVEIRQKYQTHSPVTFLDL
jgi:integrase/recombinase XerD